MKRDVARFATRLDHLLPKRLHLFFRRYDSQNGASCLPSRMPEPGYLFVAASESLLRLTTRFQFQEIGGAFVYVKS